METIKIKTGELMAAVYALQDLAQQRMPVKGAYAVSRLLMKLTPDFEAAEAQRVEIIKSVAKAGPDGADILLEKGTPEFNQFLGQFTQVTDTEIEVPIFRLDLEHLGDIAIAPATLVKLDPFLTTT